MLKTLSIRTNSQVQMIDITGQVSSVVKSSKVMSGLCLIHVPHTTAAVTINENADPAVTADMNQELTRLVPQNGRFRHMEGNSAAHVKSSLFGADQSVIIEGGSLLLGTWQGIYFCEFDGPRQRKLHVKIVKD